MPALKILGPSPATALVPSPMILFQPAFIYGMALSPRRLVPRHHAHRLRDRQCRVATSTSPATLGAALLLIFRVDIRRSTQYFMASSWPWRSFLTLIVAETSAPRRPGCVHRMGQRSGPTTPVTPPSTSWQSDFSAIMTFPQLQIRGSVSSGTKGVIQCNRPRPTRLHTARKTVANPYRPRRLHGQALDRGQTQ